MEQPQENSNGRHVLAVSLVAIIGLTGLVMMFNEVSPTGNVLKAHVTAMHNPMLGCTDSELLLNSNGVSALKKAGQAKYGDDWSPYTDAHVNYNGFAYCANADIVHELLG